MGKIVGLVFDKESNNESKVNLKLNELTLNELKDLAYKKGIEFNSKVKKDDLISLIENNIEVDEEEEV